MSAPVTGLRVLVTGMSGLIGTALASGSRVGTRSRVTGGHPGVPAIGRHGDLEAIEPAFKDIDGVVHLAAAAGGAVPWTPCS